MNGNDKNLRRWLISPASILCWLQPVIYYEMENNEGWITYRNYNIYRLLTC